MKQSKERGNFTSLAPTAHQMSPETSATPEMA